MVRRKTRCSEFASRLNMVLFECVHLMSGSRRVPGSGRMDSISSIAMTAQEHDCPQSDPSAAQGHPHDFDVQKELHQKIRNDPDYDDWEYGTEPLPHEAWVAKQASVREQPPASANS